MSVGRGRSLGQREEGMEGVYAESQSSSVVDVVLWVLYFVSCHVSSRGPIRDVTSSCTFDAAPWTRRGRRDGD